MKYLFFFSLTLFGNAFLLLAQEEQLPDTGISGVYEVMLGTNDGAYAIKYFTDFGFHVVDSAHIQASRALDLYGVNSALTSYRMQNGDVDSHGLLRILVWEKLIGPGIGYVPPETIGSRMAVMRTENIYRLYDTYHAARVEGKRPWLVTEPVADDLYGMNEGERSFFNRPILVRENAVYGSFFNHVFFQRYGYHIPGYGTVNKNAKLRTSEFTHHDFIIKVPSMAVMSYLSTALGLKAEQAPEIDGDWSKGPRVVFQMAPGESHWYQGFVSPNNICGKLKFFIPNGNKTDKTAHQRIGEKGITLHSFYTSKLKEVYRRVKAHKLSPTKIQKNEFEELSFLFTGPAGVSWQIIERITPPKNTPLTKLEFVRVDQ